MISSRADFRHEDYFFQRTQSRAMLALEWETRAPALKTWDNYAAVFVAIVLLGLAALVYP
jgi:hypothetical protein